MKKISIFNNKGGVGKTTLSFHFANALAEMNKRVLVLDLDPQCNITIIALPEEQIHGIWEAEDNFISDYQKAKESVTAEEFGRLISGPRSIHFALKPEEDGLSPENILPPPLALRGNLHIVPGRLTLHKYEEQIAKRWSDAISGNPLAIRTLTRIHQLAEMYASVYNYDYILFDTSPSLGILNKTVISTTDGFLIPCMPDMFSLYGIKNIGNSIRAWKNDFDLFRRVLDKDKLAAFPEHFVKLLGYTIYNAKKFSGNKNEWDLATAQYNYAKMLPLAIKDCIPSELWSNLGDEVSQPIGGKEVMHTHNTLPNMAQKYHEPMWRVPDLLDLDYDDVSTISGNRSVYQSTKSKYVNFAKSVIGRLERGEE